MDFNERDAFVLRTTQTERNNETYVKLFLYGKSNIYDDGYELAIQRVMDFGDAGMNHNNSILVGGVAHYA